MQAIHIKTPGLMCDECTGKVKGAVSDLPGIISVTAPHVSGTTSVMFDETLADRARIVVAIESAGFEVESD